jgi:uncharacterized protein
MKPNRFLQNAWKAGRMDLEFQIGAIGLTWGFFLLIGGMAQLIPILILRMTNPSQVDVYLSDPTNFSLLGMDMALVFLFVMTPFLVGLVGLALSERWMLRKPFRYVVTGFRRIRFKRMLAGLGLWIGMMCVYQLVMYAIDPTSITVNVDTGKFLTFLPVALLLIPLQSAFEEIAIRGQLMQGLIRLSPQKPWLPLLASSCIFAMLHILNAEVQEYGAVLMLTHYFTFGLVLGAIALIDEGLEISIGIHAANNIFSLCLVSYPGTSLETPALFQQQYMAASTDFFVMLVFVAIVYLVFFGKRKNALKAIATNISTGPAEPEDAFASSAPLS